MILTGPEIMRRMFFKQIEISDFSEKRLNPNSYNLRLSDKLVSYVPDDGPDGHTLDMRREHPTCEVTIPNDGLVIHPGWIYLARTMERTRTKGLVPMIEGRSSVGRLGLFVHVTAGFGDVGFDGYWTLELTCVQPIRIYAGVDICQIFYHEVIGEIVEYSPKAKYQGNTGIQPSKLWMDFLK
jgi:dCTP deaminase